jgi:hypothetical protein
MRKQVVGAREKFFLSRHCLHTPLTHPDNGGAREEFLMTVRHKSDPDSYRGAPERGVIVLTAFYFRQLCR